MAAYTTARNTTTATQPKRPTQSRGLVAGDRADALAQVGAMTVFESLERLGIQLTEHKHPTRAVVVDHVEQAPTQN